MPDGLERRLRDELGGDVGAIRELIFEQLPLSDTAEQRLDRLAALYFTRAIFDEGYSGLVIAGYGEDDVFPGLIDIKISGVALEEVRYGEVQRQQISPDNQALVRAFAQGEMVRLFMEGIDGEYRATLELVLRRLLDQLPRSLRTVLNQVKSQKVRARVRSALRQAGQTVVRELQEAMDDLSSDRFVMPIVTSVALLPKDQLAAMADAFVSLTSFKRQVSVDQPETVGGAIDVALISKGDGFVWIRRKHYFEADLNHHFFENYFLDASVRSSTDGGC